MTGLPSLLAALGVVGVVFAMLSFVIVLFSGAGIASDLGWIGGNLAVGIALLVSAAALNLDGLRERMSSGEARRAGKYGTSAVVTTLLSIAILAMLGFLGTRYHHRFDWSEQQIHTLSDQTVKVLAGLESDVEVLALASSIHQDAIREVLDRYAYESDRFRVEYADPNERPGLLDEYGISPEQLGEGGLVRVAIGGESVEVAEMGEESITNAIVKLTRTGDKVVYFLQGHGEKAIDGEVGGARDGFARAADALRNENYRIENLLLAQAGEVPDDADVVVVAGGARPMFDDEYAALDRYLARGGAILALVDPRGGAGFVERLQGWGVKLGDDIVIDRALALFGRAVTPMAGRYDADHAITRDLRDPRNDPTMFHEVRSVRPSGQGGDFTEIVFTGEASWAERNLAQLDAEGSAALDEDDLAGPVPVAVAGTPAVGSDGDATAADSADAAVGRLAVFGDANFASNEFIEAGRNRDLFINATNWLIGDIEAISVRPNRSRASRFQLSSEQFSTIRSASLFVLPEAIAVLGVFTWWSRRNPAS